MENTRETIAPGSEVAIIVGCGHAAGELATRLREQGWAGRVIMIGEEPHLPYQRPPLSKGFLEGKTGLSDLFLKPQATYDLAQIEVILNTRVEAIDRTNRTVTLSDGSSLQYTKLAIATGGRQRPLPGADTARAEACDNFHYLRTLDDALKIRELLKAGKRMVVVGGGYVGLEVAATAIKHGLQVTVVEAGPRLLGRVTSPAMSAFFEQVHCQAGVDIRTGTLVEGLEFDGLRVVAVRSHAGERIPADVVVVGVGLLPNTGLAEAAGLAVDNGILVDAFCVTSDPDILALGDCCNHPNPVVGRNIRLESVPNAVEQARSAASTMCGQGEPYRMVPWFWSDQYDLKLKSVGLCEGHERIVMRGTMEGRAFSLFYLKGKRILAIDTINRPQDFVMGKRLVGERIEVDDDALIDESTPLNKFFTASL
ncbi:NAD(P)/FAD-dependent oxidoreductase [Massilia niabensis]|uniref:NAD(P)/FAD-dependent oxidoreductase n=1 Tax=Massilia niabensis TaxID=544910 RepID=A0ABW0LE11_9BURK